MDLIVQGVRFYYTLINPIYKVLDKKKKVSFDIRAAYPLIFSLFVHGNVYFSFYYDARYR